MTETVGFHGLGAMGRGMAFNLQTWLATENRSLYVYNRTASHGDEVVAIGATRLESFDALVARCDVLFGMTFDDDHLMDSVRRIATSRDKRPGMIYVTCATVDPKTTEEASAILSDAGVTLLSCPVFGRPDAARAKMIVAVLAGPTDAKSRIKPYLDAMSRATWDQGEQAHLANVMKLCGNFCLVSTLEVLGEAMCLADSYGLPREKLLDCVDLFMPSPGIKNYARAIATKEFENSPTKPGFPVRGGIKDVALAINAAERMGQRLLVGEIAREHLKKREAVGGGELDWASISLAVEEDRVDRK